MAEPLTGHFVERHPHVGMYVCAVAIPALIFIGSPILALLVGATAGLVMNHALFADAGKVGKLALQAGIVLMAFRMNLGEVAATASSYVLWVLLFVPAVLALGLYLARRFNIASHVGTLLSTGTAICGATAIATLAPTIRAKGEQLAICLSIVFLLNAVAVIAFPPFGQMLGMSQEAFGVWAALAIHDTASVVAAAAQYGDHSLEVATTVKLARMLCLVPVVAIFAYFERSNSKTGVPTFVWLFLCAAAISTFVPIPSLLVESTSTLSYALIVVALFFVGTELRRDVLANVRGGVWIFASALWLVVVAATLGLTLALI